MLKGIVLDLGYFGNLSVYRVQLPTGTVLQVSAQNRRRTALRNWKAVLLSAAVTLALTQAPRLFSDGEDGPNDGRNPAADTRNGNENGQPANLPDKPVQSSTFAR